MKRPLKKFWHRLAHRTARPVAAVVDVDILGAEGLVRAAPGDQRLFLLTNQADPRLNGVYAMPIGTEGGS